jgi:D-3-phosphoglycerate dehydrogenase
LIERMDVVFAAEPPLSSELLRLPTFLGTPHIGSSTEQGILAMGAAAIEGLDSARRPSELGLL